MSPRRKNKAKVHKLHTWLHSSEQWASSEACHNSSGLCKLASYTKQTAPTPFFSQHSYYYMHVAGVFIIRMSSAEIKGALQIPYLALRSECLPHLVHSVHRAVYADVQRSASPLIQALGSAGSTDDRSHRQLTEVLRLQNRIQCCSMQSPFL